MSTLLPIEKKLPRWDVAVPPRPLQVPGGGGVASCIFSCSGTKCGCQGDGGEEQGHVDGCHVPPSVLEPPCDGLEGRKMRLERNQHEPSWWWTTSVAHKLHRFHRCRSCNVPNKIERRIEEQESIQQQWNEIREEAAGVGEALRPAPTRLAARTARCKAEAALERILAVWIEATERTSARALQKCGGCIGNGSFLGHSEYGSHVERAPTCCTARIWSSKDRLCALSGAEERNFCHCDPSFHSANREKGVRALA